MHELIGDGLNNGAESCLLKPILPDAVRDIWQFYELRKVNKNIHTMSGSSLAKVPSSIGPSTTDNPNDKPASKKLITFNLCLHNIYSDNGNEVNDELFILTQSGPRRLIGPQGFIIDLSMLF